MRAFSEIHVPKHPVPAEIAQALSAGLLDLEIGAGRGLHAIQHAKAHPERTLIAIERTQDKFDSLLQRKQNHPDLSNLHVVHADAISVITHFAHPESVDTVFLLYPNPYPKKKQANLRWHNSPFTRRLHSILKPRGRLVLATNIESYAQEARLQLPDKFGFQLESEEILDLSSPPRTHFEKKYLERGERCWNLVFSKPIGSI